MNELIDVLTENGQKTGETILKSEAHKKGIFHQTVHIWFYTTQGKILLQKRAATKEIHPSLYDVSVAGHIASGESIEIAAIREIEEEIGLTISKTSLVKIGVFKSMNTISKNIQDNEFHHTFCALLKVPIHKLTPQKSEVDGIQLVSLSTFKDEINSNNNGGKYVPHTLEYYNAVLGFIDNLLI